MTSANDILFNILKSHQDSKKWDGSLFEKIKRISNTKVGDIGQEFIESLCETLSLPYEFPQDSTGKRLKQHPWDIKIADKKFEIKTATEDTKEAFQFNHIRLHRDYDALLCVGIAPDKILFGAWSKADVTTQKAGNLVTMDKGSSATFKLTKRHEQLLPIDQFKRKILELEI